MIGERIGSYEITGVLGQGSQGIVYAARDLHLERDAAIKILSHRLAHDGRQVRRLFDEAAATSCLEHAGIVKVLDWGLDDHGRPYIAMERLHGETLFERLRRGPMTLGEATAILRQLAAALAVAHGRSDESGVASPIIHRDLKPENVLIVDEDERARCVIVDFGIAKLVTGARSTTTLSGAGAFGTLPYSSPEQCRGDGEIDHRTDLYALGCLLHEMVTGAPPFGFAEADELVRAHCQELPPDLSDGALEVPEALDALARRLLAKDPGERPASCRAVIESLDGLEIVEAIPARRLRAEPIRTLVRDLEGWRGRAWRRLLELQPWTASGVALVVGAVLLGLSIVLGVGDSYISSLNWGFTYITIVPLILFFVLSVLQRSDAALRAMVSRGMVRGLGDLGSREVFAPPMQRLGAWIVGLVAIVGPLAVAISLGEWWHRYNRAPIPGTWWTESAVLGATGAVCQGLLIAAILGFVMHSVAWVHILHGWTSPRSRLRLHPDASSSDPRAGFELLEEPMMLSLVAGALVQFALYLSNVQHIAELRGMSFSNTMLPLDGGLALTGARGLLDLGTGRYPSGVPVIASAMVAVFLSASMLMVWQTVLSTCAPAPDRTPASWPLSNLGLGRIVVGLAAGVLATIFFRLGPFVFAALIVARFWPGSRGTQTSLRHLS